MKCNHADALKIIFAAVALVLPALGAGCKSAPPKYEFRHVEPKHEAVGYGYGWGDKAEQTAKEMAAREAVAASGRVLKFESLRVEPFSIFSMELGENNAKVKVGDTTTLPDGGVTVEAFAPIEPKIAKEMNTASFVEMTYASKLPTMAERVDDVRKTLYENVARLFARKEKGVTDDKLLPEKMIGKYWVYSFDITDDGKKTVGKITAYASVSFGKVSEAEKVEVLMNAWRNAVLLDTLGAQEKKELFEKLKMRMPTLTMNALDQSLIAKQVLSLNPDPKFCEEFAAYALSKNNYADAQTAMERALQIRPDVLDYYKKLYQIAQKAGNKSRMAELEKKLEEMDVAADQMGADLTSTMTYTSHVKWVDSKEDQAAGKIHFTDVDEAENKGQKAQEKSGENE